MEPRVSCCNPRTPMPASHRMLLSPSQKSAQHLGILQTRAASACPALQGFWSYPPASLVFPVLRDARNLQLACGPLPGALDPGPPRVPARGSKKSPARLSGPDSPHHRRPGHFPSSPSRPGAGGGGGGNDAKDTGLFRSSGTCDRALGRQAGSARQRGGSHYGRFGHSARSKPTRPKLKIRSYLPPSTCTRARA